MNSHPIKRALLSVADKSGIVEFATQLNLLNIEIISTGGTSALLQAAHIPHRQVDELTGSPRDARWPGQNLTSGYSWWHPR